MDCLHLVNIGDTLISERNKRIFCEITCYYPSHCGVQLLSRSFSCCRSRWIKVIRGDKDLELHIIHLRRLITTLQLSQLLLMVSCINKLALVGEIVWIWSKQAMWYDVGCIFLVFGTWFRIQLNLSSTVVKDVDLHPSAIKSPPF